MDLSIRGDCDGGPAVDLDHTAFSYAGKFRMTATGKAIARADGEIVGAIAFSRDRTDPQTAWFRYITVRADHRGEGVGAEMAALTANRLLETANELRIAVNNPFAYHALYKAGFGYTGEQTGLAELVLERPSDQIPPQYRRGLAEFADRADLSPGETTFIDAHLDRGPPSQIEDEAPNGHGTDTHPDCR